MPPPNKLTFYPKRDIIACFKFPRTEAEFQYCKAAKKLEVTRTEVFALTQQFEASLKKIEVSIFYKVAIRTRSLHRPIFVIHTGVVFLE